MEPRHFLALLLLGACSGSESVDHDRALEPPPAHPFLVVRAEDYPALRARAAQRHVRLVAEYDALSNDLSWHSTLVLLQHVLGR